MNNHGNINYGVHIGDVYVNNGTYHLSEKELKERVRYLQNKEKVLTKKRYCSKGILVPFCLCLLSIVCFVKVAFAVQIITTQWSPYFYYAIMLLLVGASILCLKVMIDSRQRIDTELDFVRTDLKKTFYKLKQYQVSLDLNHKY